MEAQSLPPKRQTLKTEGECPPNGSFSFEALGNIYNIQI